jgi:formylglycine-generating enzyme required for sulfatase activity
MPPKQRMTLSWLYWKTIAGDSFREAALGLCPHCGAVYELTYTRLAATNHDRAVCAKCRKVMKEWNDDFSRSFRLKRG